MFPPGFYFYLLTITVSSVITNQEITPLYFFPHPVCSEPLQLLGVHIGNDRIGLRVIGKLQCGRGGMMGIMDRLVLGQ